MMGFMLQTSSFPLVIMPGLSKSISKPGQKYAFTFPIIACKYNCKGLWLWKG